MMRPTDKPMTPTIISLAIAGAALVFAGTAAAQPATPADAQRPAAVAPAATAAPELREDAPDRHVVVPGDTLWSIAGRFLKDPWRWSELWDMNKDQIRNANRIFPGDVVVINRRAAPGERRRTATDAMAARRRRHHARAVAAGAAPSLVGERGAAPPGRSKP